jgi:lysozyme family protein
MTRDDIISFVIQQEGGYSNSRGDPGRETNRGITQRYLNAARLRNANLPAFVADLTLEETIELYQDDQWRVIDGDVLPSTVALLVMDCAVNSGSETAIRILQQAAGTNPDGIMGPGTAQAVRGAGTKLCAEFAARRAVHYAQLQGTEGQFELGWMRRLLSVYTRAIT